MHEKIQSHFSEYYGALEDKIRSSMFGHNNEIYGELYYYSVVKLLKNLTISEDDHFLDVGSGLGKLVFQIFLTTRVQSVTGIEIHAERYAIAQDLKQTIITLKSHLNCQYNPHVFSGSLNIVQGDFLEYDSPDVTIVYVCSTVFSYALLE